MAGARALITREIIAWTVERPRPRHLVGSVIFAAGWSAAGTCPGPLAAMIGEGRLTGLVIAAGVIVGVVLRGATERRRSVAAPPLPVHTVAGL